MCIGGMMSNSYISISKHKLFVLSAICVLIAVTVLHIAYFEKFSREALKNDLAAKNFNFIKEHGDSIKFSAIGTSHTADALRSNEGFFFNYGRSSTWYPQVSYAKASHLLQYARDLKVLLLEVDHISILGYDPAIHLEMPEQYLYLLKHVDESLYETSKSNTYTKKSSFLLSLQVDVAPVIHRKFFQAYLLGHGKPHKVESSWANLTEKEKVKSVKKRIASYRLDSTLKIDHSVYDYYNKAITKAKEHGVKVYLIFYPQTREYLSAINKENNIKVDDFVSQLSREKGISILDYRHYFESNASRFANQDHLNKNASKVLTEEVMQVIQNYL